ncbi:MAG: ribosome small subunit-dependent GTPase A [Legionellales bacterium]|nr:ribosome small subunit-dependent GTPase A [Legionellales bacterium]
MSKRRISKQQSLRIEKKQSNHRQLANTTDQNLPQSEGLVIRHFGRHALIETSDGTPIHCSIRPSIDSLVAGDRVVFQMEGEKSGVIVSLYPRSTVLGRPDKRGQIRPVAANISQIMVVVAPKPEISWTLLDSYLVMAEYLGLPVCIVLNKMDLAKEDLPRALIEQYQPLGYPILFTSPNHAKQNNLLKNTLKDQTSVFVGQSGVGKSSLIARILPVELDIPTGAISSRTNLGTHTTSSSCLYHIPSGGSLIDSPGVREFGLWQMPIRDLAYGYREFKPYLTQCKFRNCNHIDTLGCALQKAVEKKSISRQRYKNYVKIASQFTK